MDHRAVDLARRCRRGFVGDRTRGRNRPFRHIARRGLCAAALGRRSDRSGSHRTTAQPMTEIEPSRRIAPQPWMTKPATSAVLGALAAGGAEARFVGGSVRDALLGRPIGDIDIATPAAPERVIELLEKSGIKAVPTGLAHGTGTAVVPPRQFQITTLRRDVETYGRRARVAFDAAWAADAARRDFTINAIFLAPDGTIDDPVGGLADLQARRVRFVGHPPTRIPEDGLRLLRYYPLEARFGTGIGDPPPRGAGPPP